MLASGQIQGAWDGRQRRGDASRCSLPDSRQTERSPWGTVCREIQGQADLRPCPLRVCFVSWFFPLPPYRGGRCPRFCSGPSLGLLPALLPHQLVPSCKGEKGAPVSRQGTATCQQMWALPGTLQGATCPGVQSACLESNPERPRGSGSALGRRPLPRESHTCVSHCCWGCLNLTVPEGRALSCSLLLKEQP